MNYKENFFLEYYSKYSTFRVLRRMKTSVVLSLEIFEDKKYPISRIFISYYRADNDSIRNHLWSNNANFIVISPLEVFREYNLCFAFETIRRRLSTCTQQAKTFMTAEGG